MTFFCHAAELTIDVLSPNMIHPVSEGVFHLQVLSPNSYRHHTNGLKITYVLLSNSRKAEWCRCQWKVKQPNFSLRLFCSLWTDCCCKYIFSSSGSAVGHCFITLFCGKLGCCCCSTFCFPQLLVEKFVLRQIRVVDLCLSLTWAGVGITLFQPVLSKVWKQIYWFLLRQNVQKQCFQVSLFLIFTIVYILYIYIELSAKLK